VNWELDDAGFAALIAGAARAPSVHNSQPWRFRYDRTAIEVRLDPDRVLPVADPTGRAARISCGAAAYTMGVCLAMRGTPAVVRLRPDPDDSELLARLTPAPPRPPTPTERRLHAAVPRRHSNRHPFADTAVPANLRTALLDAARAERAWLDFLLRPAEVDAVVALTRAADRQLTADDDYVRELRAWTRDGDAPDGVPRRLGGPAPQPNELLARRDFGGPPSHRTFESQPLIGVLGVTGDRPGDQVQAGMALQRVLLTATALGLATSTFTQPVDVPAVRAEIRRTRKRPEPPQLLLRFGYAVAMPPTGRRPVAEVIDA
jgi:nitroreductase